MEDPRSSQIKQRSRPEEAEELGCTRAREWRPHSPVRQRSADCQRSKERQRGSDPRLTVKPWAIHIASSAQSACASLAPRRNAETPAGAAQRKGRVMGAGMPQTKGTA